MFLSKKEIEVLQTLAKEYMDLASLPVQQEKRRMWTALLDGTMERPMVAIDQLPWNELNVDGFLTNRVSEPYFREVETALRRKILQFRYFPGDMVLNPYIILPRCIHGADYGEYGFEIQREARRVDETNDTQAYHYENQFETLEDVEKIQAPQVWEDMDKENEIRQIADYIFCGIAPYKMPGVSLHVGLWDFIAQWMGVTPIYYALVDEPELLHAIMKKTTAETLRKIDMLNAIGGFDTYTNMCHCNYTYTGSLPLPEDQVDRPTSKDVWCYGMAQLFSSCSPAVTQEYEVDYMKPIFQRFGAVYYGCCERLDDRLEIVQQLPNLRKISCSPWSNREAFAEKLDKQLIMSVKPTPALLATDSVDWEMVRGDLRRTVDAARTHGKKVELILKDISTVRYDISRLTRWNQIAMEEVSGVKGTGSLTLC